MPSTARARTKIVTRAGLGSLLLAAAAAVLPGAAAGLPAAAASLPAAARMLGLSRTRVAVPNSAR